MDIEDLIPRVFMSSWKTLEAKRGSRSEISLWGSPKHLNKLAVRRSVVDRVEIFFLQGINITPLLSKWSTKTKIELLPLAAGGRSVMKSIEVREKRHVLSAGSTGMRAG